MRQAPQNRCRDFFCRLNNLSTGEIEDFERVPENIEPFKSERFALMRQAPQNRCRDFFCRLNNLSTGEIEDFERVPENIVSCLHACGVCAAAAA